MKAASGVLLLVILAAPAAEGQLTARADAALGSAGPTPAQRGLWTVGGRLDWATPSLRLNAEGEYREFDARGAGSWGRASASWFLPIAHGITGEVTGEATGVTGPGRGAAGVAMAGGRFHFGAARHGLWFGSQAGRDGMGTVIRWEGAAWQRVGNLTVQIQGSQTSSRDLVRQSGASPDTINPVPDTVSRSQNRVHTDLGTWVTWQPGPLEFSGALGRRFGIVDPAGSPSITPPRDGGLASRREVTRSATWWTLEARWWFSPSVGLMGSAGYQPPDGSLRTPGGRFAKLGLSAALPRGRGAKTAEVPGQGPTGHAPALRLVRLADDSVEVSLPAPGARVVELMGDFTDWAPVPLTRSGDGQWRRRWRLAPGTYALNVRYDGGPWGPPPGVTVVVDEFGERTGVVVVR